MKPLRLARWLLARTLPAGVRGEAMLGDLLEELAARGGTARARRWFWRQALSLAGRYGWRRAFAAGSRGRAPRRRVMRLESLLQDVRFALRSWRRAPGFHVVVVATLALGIGAATAIFSLVHGIVLRPLPYADPERLAYLNEIDESGEQMSVSWPNFLDWRARQRSFEALALSRGESFTWTGDERAERLGARRVTGNLFAVLGVRPALGRGFTDADDRPGAEATAVVSHAFWLQQLGADPDVLGRTLTLDGRSHAVVGVLPAGFRYLGRDHDLFVPMGPIADGRYLNWRANHQGYHAVGRLREGVPLDAAAAEMRAIAADLEREHPGTNAGVGAKVVPLRDQLVSGVRQTFLVLLGAVGFLLLIACVNVANLLVARGAARQRELGVRFALGGGRWRLVSQLLVESTLLSAVGAALGTAFAFGLVALLVAVAPAGTPRLAEVGLDGSALLFALAAAAACGLLFGAFPALQAARANGPGALVRQRGAGASSPSHRLRRGLMVIEVAMALVLLAGAGLMTGTLRRLTAVDAGFRHDGLLTAKFSLGGERWRDDAARATFFEQALARLEARPEWRHVAFTTALPVEGSYWTSSFTARDKPAPPRAEQPSAEFTPVSRGYFETLDVRLVGGRWFDGSDTASSELTVVVNETLARRIWPGEEAVGKQLKQGWPDSETPWRRVVGVVADVKIEGLVEPAPPQLYLPLSQETTSEPVLVVRVEGSTTAARRAIESVLAQLDGELPVYEFRTMNELLGDSIARQRMAMLVLSVFAFVALALAAIGLYGVVAHGVTERTHEIGVRMALGAEGRQVLGLVVRQGLATALVGTAIGLAAALALSRSLRGLLFGVSATDPATLAGVVFVLLAVSAVACYVPARRAVRVDPTRALRVD
jgi:putative ABC transport system permease protein